MKSELASAANNSNRNVFQTIASMRKCLSIQEEQDSKAFNICVLGDRRSCFKDAECLPVQTVTQ